jgi:hypothetical protein
MKKEVQTIPEERVHAILARAADLDRTTFTVDALRAAALEAGISREAVDQAIEEFAATRLPAVPAPSAPPPKESRWQRWKTAFRQAAVIAPISFIVGSFAGPDAFAGFAWIGVVGAALYLIARHRPSRRAGIFQLHLAVMTAFITLGMASFAPHQDAVMAFIGASGLVLFVIGTLAIKIRITAIGAVRHALDSP